MKQQTAKPQGEKKSSPLQPFFFLLLALALSFYAYREAPKNDFVDWDDYTYVINNQLIRNPKTPVAQIFKEPISLNYHPLTILSMRWHNNECPNCFEGIAAKPFIWGNLILHLFNVALVFLLGLRLFESSPWRGAFAGLSALWFGVHPMHVESVAWVSERKDVLYVFFGLLGLLSYDLHLRGKAKWAYSASLLSFLLACLSKAMAVAFFPLMLLWAVWLSPAQAWAAPLEVLKTRWKGLLPFLGLSLFFGLMAVKVQSGSNFLGLLQLNDQSPAAINEFKVFSITERLSFAAHGFFSYLGQFFYPGEMVAFYPYPTRPHYDASLWFKINWLLWLAVLGAGAWSLKYSKKAFFALFFYFFGVVLVLQFVSVGAVIKADRYTYLPYIGLGFGLIWGLAALPKKAQLPALALAAFFGLSFIPKTQKQVEVWKNSENLWSQVIKNYPETEQAYSIRGNYYGKCAGKSQGAEQQAYLDKAFADLSRAEQLQSKRPEVFEGLGNIYGMRGKYELALKNYSQALALDPNKHSVYFNRAVTYSLLQNYEKAIADYNEAAARYPERMPEILQNRGLALLNLKRFGDAEKDFRKLLESQPNNTMIINYLGICARQLGRNDEAKALYQKVLQINPQDAFASEQLRSF